MKGIIILAHGSRQTSTEVELVKVVEMMKAHITEYEVEYGFMEFSKKTIEVGLDNLVAKGATEILAIPYFLFDGIHIREDIPEELDRYLEQHPGITIKMGKTLGADERLAAILLDRVKEAL